MCDLYEEWLHAKKTEADAVNARREIEDKIINMINIPQDKEGTTSFLDSGYKVKAVSRISRRVDADLVQEIAAENGLTEHLSSLFRWKPEINMKAWQSASPEITGPLAAAITAKPGRPSFTITREEA